MLWKYTQAQIRENIDREIISENTRRTTSKQEWDQNYFRATHWTYNPFRENLSIRTMQLK